MSQTTEHGEAIAEQIQGEDAYGYSGELTTADVWLILDSLQTHFMDSSQKLSDKLFDLFSGWMEALEKLDKDLPL